MENDIRWIRRVSNFIKALEQLRKAVAQKEYTELEEQGVIQCFEYTYELAWNTMKDLWEDQGVNNILGPRDAIQLSFQRGLIQNGEAWMYMMRSRNLTSHTYDEATAKRVVQDIRNTFTPLFDELALRLEQERVARKL